MKTCFWRALIGLALLFSLSPLFSLVPAVQAQVVPDTVVADSLARDSLGVAPAPIDSATADSIMAEARRMLAQEGQALETRMQTVFGNIRDFANVQVAVQGGVVRLTGTVAGSEASEKAEELAGNFEGVLYVENDIVEATDVETRVTPALTRIQAYWDRAIANLPAFGIAVLVLLFFGLLARFVFGWTAPFERMGVSPLVHGLLRRLISTVLFTVGLVLALDILDVTALVGAVLGTAGVVGLALGFAFQDIVENYLAGVLMSVRNPFAVNDLVKVGEHQGKVIRLTAREMVLMTLDGNHLRLPNATVFKSPIVNFTRNPKRRFTFTVGVSNDVDLVEAVKLGRDTLTAMKGVLDEPGPYVMIQELGDSNVILWFSGWVNQTEADFSKVKSEALRLVKTAFDAADYEMPEPIYRVNLIQRAEQQPPTKPEPSQQSVQAEAQTIDVSVDTELDKQVAEDLAASDEQNLLLENEEGAAKK